MARKRSIPTTLFASPDFFELSSNTIRLIFIGLILDADDEGRGCAHPRLLARKLDQQPEEIVQALVELEAHGMLRCYEVASRCFYWLCHWHTYQTLSKPTPSNYPAPPDLLETAQSQKQVRETVPVVEMVRRDERGTEEMSAIPSSASLQPKRPLTTAQVASVLHVPESEDLREIVQEFAHIPTLSVLGEAIEARAWIDDQRRNTRHQAMTPAFFRRWLRRSQRGEGTLPNSPPYGQGGIPTVGPQSTQEPDQYEVYVNALIAHYNGPEALEAMR